MTNAAQLQIEEFTPTEDVRNRRGPQSSTCLTKRYVADVINHVASVHVDYALVQIEDVENSVVRYELWREGRAGGSRLAEACEFASFFAVELMQETFGPMLSKQSRTLIAFDFIVHVVLETNLRSNVWRIEHDLPATFRLLGAADVTPDQLMTSFSLGKW